jgi:hypothetical protein
MIDHMHAKSDRAAVYGFLPGTLPGGLFEKIHKTKGKT